MQKGLGMKKFFVVFLCLGLGLSFAACTKSQAAAASATPEQTAVTADATVDAAATESPAAN
jgi:hypothetical protein